MTVDRYTNKDALGAVRELVAKWRNAWMDGYETGIARVDEATANRALAKAECADELEAALAQAPAVRVTGTHRYEESGHGWCKNCGYAAHVAEQHGAALGQGKAS